MSRHPVVVVGAGLSGLAAARRLRRRGVPSVVLEKSAGLGGRLATRRVEGVPIDHGCPSLDVRSGTALSGDVAALGAERVALSDGTTAISSGMTRLAKIIATGVSIRRGVRVGALDPSGEHVDVLDDAGGHLARAARVIVSAPGPQAAVLLASAGQETRAEALLRVEYSPALVVLAGAPRARSADVVVDIDPFSRVVREDSKRSSVDGEAIVAAQLTPEVSSALFERSDEEVASVAITDLERLIEGDARWWQIKRWRYALPSSPPEPGIAGERGERILLAGDALVGPDLAGVYSSGVSAAEASLAA